MKLYQLWIVILALGAGLVGSLVWLGEHPLRASSSIQTQCDAVKHPSALDQATCAEMGASVVN
jgi:hypothetical protein